MHYKMQYRNQKDLLLIVSLLNFFQVEWAEIGGFVCITVALLLFVLMKFSDLGGNKPAAICSMVFTIAAGNMLL